jgi:branched-chain amino acid transport system ATP-binding protein
MVAIGRALMSNPEMLLLDEPSLGLSPLLVRELFAAIRGIRETGMGLLMVEQNARESLRIADRGYVIANGKVSGSGSAAELQSSDSVRRAYLGGLT